VADKERDTARTRRLVLDAAAAVVAEQGSGASVDAIARKAGVSKGGLLHHFRSREKLLLALAEDLVDQFRAAVLAAVDPRDHDRGRLLRGYVTATFDELDNGPTAVAEGALLSASLAVVPGVSDVLLRDRQRWDDDFDADGVDPQRVLLIRRAADGTSISAIYEGPNDQAEIARTRALLLELTRGDGPIIASNRNGSAQDGAHGTG
jgi:AcrR family transcriptional regulator